MPDHNFNSWLHHKRRNLIGSDDFTPKDYGHLLWYWGVIDDQFRSLLKRYGRLRGLVLASQGRVVRWTPSRNLLSSRRFSLSEDQSIKIERQWRQLIQNMDANKIAFLDWLTQEPIDYNVSRQEIIQRFNIHLFKKHHFQ